MALPYITGYLDRISLTRGERLKVMVSCTAAAEFRATLVRTICGDLNPEGPGFREIEIASAADGTYPAREQICNAGSCIVVPPNGYFDELRSFSVQMHVWPTTPLKGEQSLLALWDDPGGCGFRLFIDAGGALAACVSDGSVLVTVTIGVPLTERQWHLVGAGYDAEARTLSVIRRNPIRAPAPARRRWSRRRRCRSPSRCHGASR